MRPFTTLTAVAMPLDIANVDTDRILPTRFLRKLRSSTKGYDSYLFRDMRFDEEGQERPEFPLNLEPYRRAEILVASTNFGCGSSREGAVYALMDYGFRAVIAASFGDIHYANEIQNGMLPAIAEAEVCKELCKQLLARPGATLSIDLQSQEIIDTQGVPWPFQIEAIYKDRLLQGADEITQVLNHQNEIDTFEGRRHGRYPWLA